MISIYLLRAWTLQVLMLSIKIDKSKIIIIAIRYFGNNFEFNKKKRIFIQ